MHSSILFIHNTLMGYRTPFFRELAKKYAITLYFTDFDVLHRSYGLEGGMEGLEKVPCRITKKQCGINPALVPPLVTGDHAVVVDSYFAFPMSLLTLFITKARRKKILYWSEIWDWRRTSVRDILTRPLHRLVIACADGFIVPGTRHRDYLLDRGARPDRIFLVPNAGNISCSAEDLVLAGHLKETYGITTGKVVLYVGRLKTRKGVDYLVRAFSSIAGDRPGVRLVIVGTGPIAGGLEDLARGLGVRDHTIFTGYVPDRLLPAHYLIGTVCVVPSITTCMAEPWALTVNEAMACGRPVIVSDAVGAAPDMVINGHNGFIVPERDTEALSAALRTILDDPALEERMGRRSREIIGEFFTYDRMVAGFDRAVDFVTRK
jgi:glycosyltransferase involved in cell wall biosynthesis